MTLRIVTLSEDRVAGPDLIGQLGLSILIESGKGNILFDAGQGISASHNADVIGFDLTTIDRIVLSHGHFDHTGGIGEMLQRIHKKEIEVTGHPDIWDSKYVRNPEKAMDRYVGIPFRREELERLGARFNLRRQSVKLTDHIITTGEVPMITDFEKLSPTMLVREGAEWRPDELLDDQAIIVTTEYGLIVILGCAHRGVINTIYHARKITGIDAVYMVLGGSHLIGSDSGPRIHATIEALKDLDVQKVGMSHCTGLPASVQMAQELGERFFFNNAGTVISVE